MPGDVHFQDVHFQLDQERVRRFFQQAAGQYDDVAQVAREIGDRLLERLDLVRLTPARVLDVGCATGVTTAALLRRYPKAQVLGLDLAPAMLQRTRKRGSWWRRPQCLCADAQALPLADASCDLVFSNLALSWCSNLDQVFRELCRVLTPNGLLLFTLAGPDTLKELRQSWQAADSYTHVHAFMDMHDVGDALLRAQLAEPVMDMELLTVTYRDSAGLLRDLRRAGARNAAADRPVGLTGRRRYAAMQQAYEQLRRDGVIPATVEVVYGHAWGPAARLAQQQNDGTAVFPLARLRRR